VAGNAAPGRQKFDSVEDQYPTMAMDREGLDVLPGGRALRTPKPGTVVGAPPIPNFRPQVAEDPATVATPPPPRVVATGAATSYAIWVFAGILAAIVSYHVAPEIFVHESAAHAAER
jgi:hypothetical protein